MIIEFSAGTDPNVTDTDRFDRLSVTIDGAPADARLGEFGRLAPDGEHVWLDIAVLRAALGTDADALGQYDGMIAYAVTKGWANEAGTEVRAHIAR